MPVEANAAGSQGFFKPAKASAKALPAWAKNLAEPW
jgi:hypothetical protein